MDFIKQTKSQHLILMCILLVMVCVYLTGCGEKAQEKKVYRVGILHVSGAFSLIRDGFKAKMTELGYIEGQNITYDNLEVPQKATPAEAQAVAQKFVDDKVDLIFAFPTPSAIAAHAATGGTNIPVIFVFANLEGTNLIESVREPGGNMTGVRYPGPEVIIKRLEILLEIVPHVKRVWIGYDKNHSNTTPTLEVLRPAAASLGVTLVEVPAGTLGDLEADLKARAASAALGLDAIILMLDGFNQGPKGYALLSTFAAEHNVPLAGGVLSTVEHGAVFGNSPNLVKAGELAAPLADKIFKGTPVGTIPVLTPEQELYINYKVAQELGLRVSEGLLSMADEIIR
jgi:putative ABC transport system substrate-binding protein